MRSPRILAPVVVAAVVLALGTSACSGSAQTSAQTSAQVAEPAAVSTPSAPAAAALAATPTVAPTVPVSIVPGLRLRHTAEWKAAKERIALARKAEAAQRRAVRQNPLAGREWGVYHGDADQAWGPYQASGGTDRALLSTIVEEPKAQWFGAWIPDDQIYAAVQDYIANAQAGDPDALVQFAVFRMEPWEHEACSRLPSAAEQASYKRWIDSFAAAVGDTPAAIILQPDGPFALCVPGGSGLPSSLVAYSASVFGDLPNAATYIDAGSADWPAIGQGGVPQVLKFLIPAGIEDVRGIALNSTHYASTADEVQRGSDIVEALAAAGIPDKKVVINTSSNGRPFVFGEAPGNDPDHATVCASPADQACVTLGIPPTTEVADPAWGLSAETAALATANVDGYLWFGRPWLYRQNSPFDRARALQLARTTPY